MTTALREVLARLETLAGDLDPQEEAYALEALESLARRLESDRQWDELLASPESQAYLLERGKEVMREFEAGKTEEGGWE
jgi:hypothetical protein